MPTVVVTETEKGKFHVLINYIQTGIDYTSRELAESEAKKIRERYEELIGHRVNATTR